MVSRFDVAGLYNFVTLHLVPGPRSLSYFIPVLLLPCALCIPPAVLTAQQLRSIVIPILFSCQVYTWTVYGGVDVISQNMGATQRYQGIDLLSHHVCLALAYFYFIGLTDPRKDFKRVHRAFRTNSAANGTVPEEHQNGTLVSQNEKSSPAFELEPFPVSMWQRFPWVGTLCISIRLTDWHIGSPSHDKRQPARILSFREFFGPPAYLFVFCYLLLDITSTFILRDEYFYDPTVSIMRHPSAPISTINNISKTIIRCLLLLGHVYGVLNIGIYALPALLLFPVCLVSPSYRSSPWCPLTWEPHYGPISAIWERGLRGFWGVHWHQNMRIITTAPGKSIAKKFGISPRSRIGYLLVVISAFFFSGLVHTGLVPPEPLFQSMSTNSTRLRIAGFFWLQAVGIGIEEVVVSLVSRYYPDLKGAITAHTLTFIWILCWFCLTIPLFGAVGKEIGWWRIRAVPIRVLSPALFG